MLTGTLVVGVAGKDYLDGGDGNDTLTGQGGADLVVRFNTNRHSGDDVLRASARDARVNAGGGDDYTDADSGNRTDTLFGDDTSSAMPVADLSIDKRIAGPSEHATHIGDAVHRQAGNAEQFVEAA
jgi:hypothetical protein